MDGGIPTHHEKEEERDSSEKDSGERTSGDGVRRGNHKECMALTRVEEMFPGNNGIVKEVKVRTARGPSQEPASASVHWKEWGK